MKRRGFTLIELMVTIVIITLLVGISALSYKSAQASQRDTQRLSDISLIATQIDQVTALGLSYPDTTKKPRGVPPSSPSNSYNPLTHAGSTTHASMCADGLYDPTNANQLDYSVFSSAKSGTSYSFNGHTFPLDPKPADSSLVNLACTSVANGYFYALNYPGNIADTMKRTYVLEVALERASPSSESQFQVPPAGSIAAVSGRTVYVLPGPAMP